MKILSKLESVESCDHYLAKWSFSADVQVANTEAGVFMKENKNLVIGGYYYSSSEVYESICKNYIITTRVFNLYFNSVHPTIFGKNTVVFGKHTIYKYAINKNKWLQCDYKYLTEIQKFNYSCVKVHSS